MGNSELVNIGTAEKPVLVSEKALHPKTAEGREWWGEVASGSVVLEESTLDLLIKKADEEDH